MFSYPRQGECNDQAERPGKTAKRAFLVRSSVWFGGFLAVLTVVHVRLNSVGWQLVILRKSKASLMLIGFVFWFVCWRNHFRFVRYL